MKNLPYLPGKVICKNTWHNPQVARSSLATKVPPHWDKRWILKWFSNHEVLPTPIMLGYINFCSEGAGILWVPLETAYKLEQNRSSQGFSNASVYQSHPKSLLNHLVLNPHPRAFDSVSLRWDKRICISNEAQMILSLLPWGTHFKNHCFHTCKEGYLPFKFLDQKIYVHTYI